jgi:mannose-1-phosphate guanylyltransferase
MRAVVLVGGEGTRLRPLTLTTPKQMLPIVEQPMIERVIGHLAGHGIEEAVLSLGYRPDAFINAYPGGSIAGVQLSYAVEPTPLDTAGAIRFAAEHGAVDDTFVVVNGDVLTDADLSALIEFHRQSGAEATIGLTPVDDPSAFGVVPTDPDGRVEAFIEKPPRDEAPTNLINAGSYVFEPSVLGRIPSGRRVSIERETFPALVDAGTLFAKGSTAYWLDTGTPDAYLRAHRDLLLGLRSGPPSPGAELDAALGTGVWRIGTVDVQSTKVVRSLFGQGASVDAGAVVDESVIGAGAVTASGTIIDGQRVAAGV